MSSRGDELQDMVDAMAHYAWVDAMSRVYVGGPHDGKAIPLGEQQPGDIYQFPGGWYVLDADGSAHWTTVHPESPELPALPLDTPGGPDA